MTIPPNRCPLIVIGVGNPDRGDDGIGPLVAARLKTLPGVRVVTRNSDAFAIIEECCGAEAAVLIDAAAVISNPGRIHRIDLAADELPCELGLASTHAFGLAEAIALARALNRLPRRVIVYAVEGVCFDPGAVMTAEVAAAAEEVVSLIAAEVLLPGLRPEKPPQARRPGAVGQ
ncbi:MAG TPA: hydrogenase maturation protease [Steroidobacteraceae bacterium]|nr:hydrogenase maturation protease [Steroidobacteraceae bacterium]